MRAQRVPPAFREQQGLGSALVGAEASPACPYVPVEQSPLWERALGVPVLALERTPVAGDVTQC